jgi:hypothetical protein
MGGGFERASSSAPLKAVPLGASRLAFGHIAATRCWKGWSMRSRASNRSLSTKRSLERRERRPDLTWPSPSARPHARRCPRSPRPRNPLHARPPQPPGRRAPSTSSMPKYRRSVPRCIAGTSRPADPPPTWTRPTRTRRARIGTRPMQGPRRLSRSRTSPTGALRYRPCPP